MTLTKQSKAFIVSTLLISLTALGSSELLEVRQFDNEAMSAYVGSREFDYMNYQLQTASIWDILRQWLIDLWNEFWNNPVTSRLTMYLFIAVMFGLAVFYLIKIKYGVAFTKSSRGIESNQMTVSEDIHEVNYKVLIEQAIESQDYKLAIRYLYLSVLAKMAAKEVITLKEWKTPYDYSFEMPKTIQTHYSQLSMLFEYAWYGDFGVNRADFEKGRNLSEKIQKGL